MTVDEIENSPFSSADPTPTLCTWDGVGYDPGSPSKTGVHDSQFLTQLEDATDSPLKTSTKPEVRPLSVEASTIVLPS